MGRQILAGFPRDTGTPSIHPRLYWPLVLQHRLWRVSPAPPPSQQLPEVRSEGLRGAEPHRAPCLWASYDTLHSNPIGDDGSARNLQARLGLYDLVEADHLELAGEGLAVPVVQRLSPALLTLGLSSLC